MTASLFAPTALPPPDEMYRALIQRDTSFDGVFFAAITTTGIFCRPGCGAKKPRRENVEFFPSAREALFAGYRACLRCRPLENGAAAPPHIQQALDFVEANPARRIRASDLRALDLSPERITRYFKQRYGLTFQAYCRARRVGRALKLVARPNAPAHTPIPPTPAALAHAAGYESESGFHEAFTALFGNSLARSPRREAPAEPVHIRWLPTPLGPMLAGASSRGVCLLEFTDRRALEAQVATLRRRLAAPFIPAPHAHLDSLAAQLAEYFAGTRRRFTLPLHAPGTPFQQQVWQQLQSVSYGTTQSYLDLARAIGRPTATRAVARANGDNRIAILIPCHRIIGADGSLTGYGGQLWRKERLLALEGARRAAAPSAS